MSNNLPTVEEAFGKLPTVDEAFGSEPTASDGPDVPLPSGWVKPLSTKYTSQGPYQGPASDEFFGKGSIGSAAGKILDAVGQGFKDGWGSKNQSLYQNEIDKETRDNDESYLKAASEAWLRPAAAAADVVAKLPSALFGAATEGAEAAFGPTLATDFVENLGKSKEQITAETNESSLPTQGEGSDKFNPYEYAFQFGTSLFGLKPAAGVVDHVTALHEARAEGIVGPQGEKGFFETEPLTPEEEQIRRQAADEAGQRLGKNNKILPPVPKETAPALPDIHTLARQIAPETFSKYDRLLDIQENLRLTKTYLEGQIEGPEGAPQTQKILGNLQDVRGRLQDIDLQLRDLLPETSAAKNRVQELLASESKEGSAYRDYVQAQALENAIRLQELSPDVSDAYHHAKSLVPAEEEHPERGPQEAPQAGLAQGAYKSTQDATRGPGGPPKPSETEVSQVSPEAVEKGLRETFEGTPEFQGVNYKTESENAKSLVDSNPEQAKRIALGLEASPGVHPQAVLRAVKELAYKTNDTELMEKLADSPLNQHASKAGQTLSLRRGIFDFDPVNLMSQLNDARLRAAGGLKAEGRIQNITDTLKDRLSRFDENWRELVSQVMCPPGVE